MTMLTMRHDFRAPAFGPASSAEIYAAALEQYEKHKALLKRANKLLENEAKHPTNDPSPAAEAGAILLRIGQERLGLHWLDQALQRDPGHLPTHQALARVHFTSPFQSTPSTAF